MERVNRWIIALSLGGVAYAQPYWVGFDPSKPEGSAPEITVLSSDQTQTTVKIKVPGMWREDTVVSGTTFQILTLPECPGPTSELGKPQLPVISRLVGIPPQSGVVLEVVDSKNVQLSGYWIFPAQVPPTDSGPKAPFVIDSDFYATDIFYPEGMARKGPPAISKI